ncbi:hypothetical protein [Klenkia brasiliensis]|uniref:Uncharacterized protein n=1 Tax=Klenkia brasiliensis TaxID=333142 RepID=A0A1G7T912_9ACTN|nr:hypothetical protein [Klenkia brasiliensis]SDG31803.1 hypothetical protein SAMN05660324_2366 [Klenkia brasiliensis]
MKGALDWLLADRTRSDRHWTVAQWPNAAAWVFLALTLLRQVVDGGPWGTAVFVGTRVALVWWAGDELLRGVNPFRRALGGAVLAWTAVGLLS